MVEGELLEVGFDGVMGLDGEQDFEGGKPPPSLELSALGEMKKNEEGQQVG